MIAVLADIHGNLPALEAVIADLQQRSEQVRAFLPQVWQVAEAIMDANPAIEAS